MSIQNENQQRADNQNKRENHRLRIGEVAVIPLLQNIKHDLTKCSQGADLN